MKLNKLLSELNRNVKFSLQEEEVSYTKELEDKVYNFIENPKEKSLDYLEQGILGNTYFYSAYRDFYHNPSKEFFQRVIDGIYYYVSKYIIAFFEGKTVANTELYRSSLLLASMTFCDKTEQEILYKAFIDYLNKSASNDLYREPFCQETLFQLAFLIYDENAKTPSDKQWKSFIKNKSLTPLYSNFLSLYLSDEEEKLNECVNEACNYHLSKCKDTYTSEFYMTEWRLLATEILTPIFFRYKNGKNIDFISRELRDITISEDVQKLRKALFIKYDRNN
jgi:hypothetical protein